MATVDLEASDPREAARLIAAEIRRQGYPVADGLVEALEREIEGRIGEASASRRIEDRVRRRLRTPLRRLGLRMERVARDASRDAVDG